MTPVHRFYVPQFTFEAGVTLPVEIGYETYGALNADKSNGILLCHFFSANSHAASGDEGGEAGWWEGLIGPGRAFDTQRFFILCPNVLCNVQAHHPQVITTGPASIHPQSGEKYGLSFPQVTIRDFVRVQRLLLHSLGIKRLFCVAGPSMGGMQAMQWAVDFPEEVERVLLVISGGRTPPFTSVSPLQLGIDAILADPVNGLNVAAKAMTIQARCPSFATKAWGYAVASPQKTGDVQPLPFQEELDRLVRERLTGVDPLHWVYISRACQLYNLARGYSSYEDALQRVRAKVMAIPCSSDLLFPPEESRDLVNRLRRLGKQAACVEFVTDNGHLAGVYECEKISGPISAFLSDQPLEDGQVG